jgi:cytochrome c biogenesis protein
LREEGVNLEQGWASARMRFFNDALSALAALPTYGSPFYLQLTGFQQVEASGLQVTRSGATGVVYLPVLPFWSLASFIMFYTSHRRLWAWLAVRMVASG